MDILQKDTWAELRRLAIAEAEREPILSGHLYDLVIRHRGYPEALAYLIAASLGNQVFNAVAMSDLCNETLAGHPDIITGDLIETRKFQDPSNLLRKKEEEKRNADQLYSASVRNS